MFVQYTVHSTQYTHYGRSDGGTLPGYLGTQGPAAHPDVPSLENVAGWWNRNTDSIIKVFKLNRQGEPLELPQLSQACCGGGGGGGEGEVFVFS